ncbi:uncharacterized protein [Paramormyrops kingsleyae]|uniref:uncharacterized protein isoform X2 n=1 Tax=Paramormyrops kingsleyae TaxID=1676925 RepID=UPI003B971B4C
MEKKWEEIFNYLSKGLYSVGLDKGQRQTLRKYSSKFSIHDGKLFFGGTNQRRVIKTKEEAMNLFKEFHASPIGGHAGVIKTRTAMCSRFYWYGMTTDVAKWVSECDQCQRVGPPLTAVKSMDCIKVSAVWELIGIDLSGPLPKTSTGFQYILMATDYFSKWVEAFPQKTKSAVEVAKNLCALIYRLGCPQRILSDQGQEFVNQINDKLCKLLSIERSIIAAYHPQTNVLDETTNDDLKRALKELVNQQQNHWDLCLDATLFSLRSKIHTTTKFSPFKLMYGRQARFPSKVPVKMLVTQAQRENRALKRRIQLLEPGPTREPGCAGCCSGNAAVIECVPRSRQKRGRGDVEDVAPLPCSMKQSADMEEDAGPESLLIKEERLEEDLERASLHGDLDLKTESNDGYALGINPLGTRGMEHAFTDWEVTVGAAVRNLDPVINTASPKASKGHEEFTEHHGSHRCLSEVSGLETVLKAEPERASGRKVLQHSASEQSTGRLASLYCDYTAYSRRGHLRTFFAHGVDETDADDPSCSYATEMDSEGLSFHSELQHISAAEDAGDSVSVGSADMKPELVMVDSLPEDTKADVCSAWDGDALPVAAAFAARSHDKGEGHGDRKERERVFNVCLPQVPMTSVAPVPLPPNQSRPTAPLPYSGPLHQYHWPASTAGQAMDKGRSVAPYTDAPHAACSRISVPRQIIHQPAVSAPHPVSLTTPTPVQSSIFMVVTPQIPAAVPIAPVGPTAPAKRAYRRTVGSNRCSKCNEPRHKDNGHSQYYGYIYCPHNADMSLQQWKEDMRRKRAERKKFVI